MRNYLIAVSSTCDTDREWLDEHQIPVLSYSFEIDGKAYPDDCREETRRHFYALMREGKLPNTSQITPYAYLTFFRELVSQKRPVLYLEMDSAISGSYSNACQAAAMLKEEDPKSELYVLDTRSITMGFSLLLKRLVKMQEEGASFEEVKTFAEDNCKKVIHRFFVDDLSWLQRGGRLSNASAFIGTLLSVKPLIYLDEEGKLIAAAKVRGRQKAIHELLEKAAAEIGTDYDQEIIVGHSDCPEDGKKWEETVRERFPKASVSLQELGPVIGSHVGPGFLSIVYFAEERRA
ncbi:MAG: DegV family protein [Erysipelotrichaceae bacterium]|nr:DegV family protein [Erysipelotrichaceae bacterium]